MSPASQLRGPDVEEVNRRGYYDIPVIHGSHWKWLVIWYFYLGGISGSAAAIAAIARLAGRRDAVRLARVATYVSFAALLPCPPLLILDLGRPTRFLNMLRTIQPSSPMSLGSWGLAAFGIVSTFAAALQASIDLAESRGHPPAAIQHRFQAGIVALCALLGLFVAGYTGTLLAATAVPLWSKRPAILGPLFLASAITSGTAAVSIVGAATNSMDARSKDSLHRFEAMSSIAEGALLVTWLLALGPTGKPVTEGWIGSVMRHGVVGAGMALPMITLSLSPRLPPRSRRLAHVISPAMTLVGVFALRYAVVVGGRLSADDPQATFDMTE